MQTPVHTHTFTASSRVVINYFVGAFRNYFKHPTYAPTSIQGIEFHNKLKKNKFIVKQKVQKIQAQGLQAINNELLYGAKVNKYVDIKDEEDFPDLGDDEGPVKMKKGTQLGGYVITEQPKQLAFDDE